MHRGFWSYALVLTVTLSLSTLASAGEIKDGIYTSGHGYTVKPPEDWKIVDRGNQSMMKQEMPSALAKAPTKSSYDVLFYDGSIEDKEPEPIFDNIMIAVVPSVPTVTTETANALAEAEKTYLEKVFSEVVLQRAEVAKHNGIDAIELEWSVAGEDEARKGFLLQTILPSVGTSLIVTCAFGIESAESFKETCSTTLKSVAFK